MAFASTMTTYFSLGILAFLTWPILFVIIPSVRNHTHTGKRSTLIILFIPMQELSVSDGESILTKSFQKLLTAFNESNAYHELLHILTSYITVFTQGSEG